MPWIPTTDDEQRDMLDAVGANSINELFNTIPTELRLNRVGTRLLSFLGIIMRIFGLVGNQPLLYSVFLVKLNLPRRVINNMIRLLLVSILTVK